LCGKELPLEQFLFSHLHGNERGMGTPSRPRFSEAVTRMLFLKRFSATIRKI